MVRWGIVRCHHGSPEQQRVNSYHASDRFFCYASDRGAARIPSLIRPTPHLQARGNAVHAAPEYAGGGRGLDGGTGEQPHAQRRVAEAFA